MTNIGETAFANCYKMISITIPNSVKSIGYLAFSGCRALTSINVPKGVTCIEDFTFRDCSSLSSISIPDGVTSIGENAFCFCSSLTSVTIPNSVKNIGGGAFSVCGLTSLIIPDGVTSIGSGALGGCRNLKSIIIPNSMTFIGSSAFEDCNALKDVYCWAEKLGTYGSQEGGLYAFVNSFNGSYLKNVTLHVPEKSIEAYEETKPWSQFGKIVALSDNDPQPTSVKSLKTGETASPVATYSIDGRRLSQPQRGLNIILMSDGTTKKVYKRQK